MVLTYISYCVTLNNSSNNNNKGRRLMKFTTSNAVKELKLLRCKKSYNNNEILDYHTCLNIIEEELCNGDSVIIDLSTFDTESPDECYRAIQNAKKR